MNTYEVITLLFSFGLFLIALLTYIDKRKIKMPILSDPQDRQRP
jgi:hypothetical protein